MQKKANILDWFFIIVILFATAMAVFAGYKILYNDQIQALWEDGGVTEITSKSQSAIRTFDNIMLFIIVGLSIFLMISAAIIYEHPAFFFVSIVLLLVAGVFAAIISNAFWDFANQSTMVSINAAYPKITFLMNHLAEYVIFMGIVVGIIAAVSYNR